jgi:putative transposase
MLGVSPSGFYAWHNRPPSARAQADAALQEQIQTIYARSRRTYGTRRVHAELRALGVRCGRKRAARLMRDAGLVGAHRRRLPRTTWRDRNAAPVPDLVRRQFTTPVPNRLWVADITYVRTGAGWLYLAIVLDVFSRRVVGWAMRTALETTLVLDALNMALWNRRPAAGVVHHSDRGVQYTSLAYGRRCQEAGVVPSMGSAGDAYDKEWAACRVGGGGRPSLTCYLRPPFQTAHADFPHAAFTGYSPSGGSSSPCSESVAGGA